MTTEEKLQKDLKEAKERIRYLERRIDRLGAIATFIARYDQEPPTDSESYDATK